jgi:hypothetical protein
MLSLWAIAFEWSEKNDRETAHMNGRIILKWILIKHEDMTYYRTQCWDFVLTVKKLRFPINSDVYIWLSYSLITGMGSSIIWAKAVGLKRLTCIREFAGSNLVWGIELITEAFLSLLHLFRSDCNVPPLSGPIRILSTSCKLITHYWPRLSTPYIEIQVTVLLNKP